MPKEDEILIRIRATTVNSSDCGWRAPHPFFSRLFTGLLRPKRPILGSELAGVVEAVGSGVTKGLIESGEYRAVIDRVYQLGDVVEATQYVETGRRQATSC